jgi:hypothetical protein
MTPTMSNEVATGRRMNGSEILTAFLISPFSALAV